MKHFALIGYPLGHSLSAKYFAEKFSAEGIEAEYSLLPIEHAEEVLPHCETLSGFNVTIPTSSLSSLSSRPSVRRPKLSVQ